LSRLIDLNHTALVKNPVPNVGFGNEDPLQVVEAWEIIYTQFSEALGGVDNVGYLHLLSEIARLELKLDIVHELINSNRKHPDEGIKEQLKKRGIANVENMDIAEAEAKQWVLQLHAKKVAYLEKSLKVDQKTAKQALHDCDYDVEQALNKLNETKPKSIPTYEMYDGIILRIDPKLNAADITTERFCGLYKELRRKVKQEQFHGTRATDR
jgi:hypothetical protein